MKKYDLAVKTGEYTKDGETKGRYENVGSVMQGENGPYILMKRTFNPAGVPARDGKDSLVVYMFEPRAKEEGRADAKEFKPGLADMNDDIPF